MSLLPRPKPYALDAPENMPPAPPPKPRIILQFVPLEELDLSAELYDSYCKAKQLYQDAVDEPLNQKVQTLNAIAAMQRSIASTRTELYNAERLKKMESVLLEILKEHPALSAEFIEKYEAALAKA